jgi:predicted kinase
MNIKIMRGISGAGKSTYIRNHWDEWGQKLITVSADTFFVVDGVYRFDPKQLGDAHAMCLREYVNRVLLTLDPKDNNVLVVDNTNLSAVEIAPYYQLAVAYGIPVEIINIDYDPNKQPNRNTHGVPDSKVKQMFDRANRERRNFPSYWKVTDVKSEG